MKRVRLVIPYFGTLPEWFDLFARSCAFNSRYDWLIVTDDEEATTDVANVTIERTSFDAYRRRLSAAIGLDVSGMTPYKLCDLKPFIGVVHADDIRGYDFWGYGDLDVLYGDLDAFYPEELLSTYRIISTKPDMVTGHFALFANTDRTRRLCFRIRDWRKKLLDPEPTLLDEYPFAQVAFPLVRRFRRFGWALMRAGARRDYSPVLTGGVYAREMYTTPIRPFAWHDGTRNWDQPTEWVWENGRMRSVRDGFEVPYLHFMNYKSSRYLVTGQAPWTGLQPVVHRPPEDHPITSIRVDLTGIHAT